MYKWRISFPKQDVPVLSQKFIFLLAGDCHRASYARLLIGFRCDKYVQSDVVSPLPGLLTVALRPYPLIPVCTLHALLSTCTLSSLLIKLWALVP